MRQINETQRLGMQFGTAMLVMALATVSFDIVVLVVAGNTPYHFVVTNVAFMSAPYLPLVVAGVWISAFFSGHRIAIDWPFMIQFWSSLVGLIFLASGDKEYFYACVISGIVAAAYIQSSLHEPDTGEHLPRLRTKYVATNAMLSGVLVLGVSALMHRNLVLVYVVLGVAALIANVSLEMASRRAINVARE